MGGAVPALRQKRKSAREISLRAHFCDDWNLRQGGQGCQQGFVFGLHGHAWKCLVHDACLWDAGASKPQCRQSTGSQAYRLPDGYCSAFQREEARRPP